MKLVSNQITLKEAKDRIKKADIETAIKILDDIALQDNIEAQLILAEILFKEELFLDLKKSRTILERFKSETQSFYLFYEYNKCHFDHLNELDHYRNTFEGSSWHIESINNPKRVDRMQWFYNLAYSQFTHKEIESGLAEEIVNA